MPRALLVAGPPHDRSLWEAVHDRLAPSLDCELLALPEAGAPDPTVEGQAGWIGERLASAGSHPLLVAHGLALPAAIRAAARYPGTRLVLGNGPICRLDPISAALAGMARVPGLLPATLFQPALVLRWLYSSAGLRRAVRNPYVMDRDTVVAICGPTFATTQRRRAVTRYLATLPQAVRSTPIFDGPCLALWGDEDQLYPPHDLDEARLVLPALQQVEVPGGRQLHPVERPWLIADAIVEWAARS